MQITLGGGGLHSCLLRRVFASLCLYLSCSAFVSTYLSLIPHRLTSPLRLSLSLFHLILSPHFLLHHEHYLLKRPTHVYLTH